jgi:protein O-GlcNAc transferase
MTHPPADLFAAALDHHRAGRLAAAEDLYCRVLDACPDNPDALRLLGLVYFRRGDAAGAVEMLAGTVARHPGFLDARRCLALVLTEIGDLEAALAHQHAALALAPDDPDILGGIAELLHRLGQTEQALAYGRRATDQAPDHPGIWSNLSILLASAGQLAAAERAARQAAALAPDDAGGLAQLGNARLETGDLDGAISAYDRALRLNPHHPAAGNRLYALSLHPDIADVDLADAFRAWGARHPAPDIAAFDNCRDPGRRLRIGYVSADFARHPVGYFLATVLAAHDPAGFEIHCYSGRERGDDLTERLRTLAHVWHDIAGLSNPALAEHIHADRIDILVDLSGHTAGNRLRVFARRPAPVQATWGGLIGTTGLPAMGWLIADPQEVPPCLEPLYSERVTHLPHGYVCWEPPAYAPPVGPLPALANGYVTFGCFNRLAKIGPGVIALWAHLLTAVPNARLILKTRELACPDLSARLAAHFAMHGIGPDRLDLRSGSPHPDLLATYGEIDLALDPFPYSGGLTTLEALWMGVPVITLGGSRFCARHSLSHLTVAGCTDFIADGPDTYVAIATAWANDPARLAGVRTSLRERIAASPLCDGPGFTRGLEAAFRAMWEDWCSKGYEFTDHRQDPMRDLPRNQSSWPS